MYTKELLQMQQCFESIYDNILLKCFIETFFILLSVRDRTSIGDMPISKNTSTATLLLYTDYIYSREHKREMNSDPISTFIDICGIWLSL